MLLLHKDSTGEKMVVTVTEKTTITNAYYLFIFEHLTTKVQVAFIAPGDLSPYPLRYNEFLINTSNYITKVGQYSYTIYEQDNDTNTDPTGLNIVEVGRMELKETVTPLYQTNAPDIEYITYAR